MAVTIVASYAILIVIICISVFFAEARKYLINTTISLANIAFLPIGYIYKGIRNGALRSGMEVSGGWSRLRGLISVHRWWFLASLALILLPGLLLVIWRNEINVGTYAEVPRNSDAVISALLAGERLAPPLPLPPETFTTVEVESIRPALANASRDWSLFDDSFSQRLLRVFQRMREHGYEMALLEGYRSPERQNTLAAIGSNVTNARAFQSYHQFGLAADCAFIRNGRIVISEKDAWAMRGYELYGQEAEAMGLTWGGRWKMMDFGHVELRSRKLGEPS